MKFKILALLVVVFLFGFKGKQKNIESHYRFEFHVVRENDNELLISTTLFNNSDKPFTYITMTCNSSCTYNVESEYWVLPEIICEYNAPIKRTIAPYDKFRDEIKLKVNAQYKGTGKYLRIGFKLFKSDVNAMSGKPDSIIWSDKMNTLN